MAIDTIVFDLGNVLVSIDAEPHIQLMKKNTTCSWESLRERLWADYVEYEKGLIDTDTYYKRLQEKCGLTLTQDKWQTSWQSMFKRNQPMIDLLHRLKENYALYMISNTCSLHRDIVWSDFSDILIFNDYILSFEVGLRKPDPQIYQLLSKRFNRKLDQCVFIDDLVENIESARNLGIHGIVHESNEKTFESLSSLSII